MGSKHDDNDEIKKKNENTKSTKTKTDDTHLKKSLPYIPLYNACTTSEKLLGLPMDDEDASTGSTFQITEELLPFGGIDEGEGSRYLSMKFVITDTDDVFWSISQMENPKIITFARKFNRSFEQDPGSILQVIEDQSKDL